MTQGGGDSYDQNNQAMNSVQGFNNRMQTTKNYDTMKPALFSQEGGLPTMSNGLNRDTYMSRAQSDVKTMRQGGFLGANNDLASLDMAQ